MKLFILSLGTAKALLDLSGSAGGYGFLTSNCTDDLCIECGPTFVIGSVKYSMIDTSGLRGATKNEKITELQRHDLNYNL